MAKQQKHEISYQAGKKKVTQTVRGTVQSVVNKLRGAPATVHIKTVGSGAETTLKKTLQRTAKGGSCYRAEGASKVVCKGGRKPKGGVKTARAMDVFAEMAREDSQRRAAAREDAAAARRREVMAGYGGEARAEAAQRQAAREAAEARRAEIMRAEYGVEAREDSQRRAGARRAARTAKKTAKKAGKKARKNPRSSRPMTAAQIAPYTPYVPPMGGYRNY